MKPLNISGIVVCGGQSSRMGQDKSLLTYYKEPQRYHVAQMLQPFCHEVYISLNATQQDENYEVIGDSPEYLNNGPLTALLSAYEKLPGQNLLFIGCDYPLLNENELSLFLQSITENTAVKTFFNEAENFYEPLLAYYSSGFQQEVMLHFRNGNFSLQKILVQCSAEKYFPQDKNILKSVDSTMEYEKMMDHIKKR